MAFASIYAPDFSIQAVLRGEAAYHSGAIALLDGTPPVETVVAANPAALRAGIELGMTKSQAEDFRVPLRRRSQAQEKTAHAALLDLGWSFSPRIQDTAPDTIVLDLAGLGGLFGSEENIARQLTERASGLGLAVNIAVASHIEAAIHASRGFSGITLIPSGKEEECLGRLPVRILSPSEEILDTLDRWGIHTCKEFAVLPLLQLSERFGQEGVRLHELARGAGERSLILAQPEFHFEEEMELDCAVEELEPLAFVLGRLLDQLCARLAARSLAASAIRSRFVLERSFEEDLLFNEQSGQWNGDREKAASAVYEKVLTLPVPMRDSKLLLNLLRLQFQSDPPKAPILKIILAAEPAHPRVSQVGLFLPTGPDPEKLELTIAKLANLLGQPNVGAAELVDTHRPLEFRMAPFVAEKKEEAMRGRKGKKEANTAERNDEKEGGILRAGKAGLQGLKPFEAHGPMSQLSLDSSGQELRPPKQHKKEEGTCDSSLKGMALRVFRPELPARVEMKEERPAHVAFGGMRGDVVTASGPWCSSGDWWREDAWLQDEWDLEIQFRGASKRRVENRVSEAGDKHDEEEKCRRGVYRFFYDAVRKGWFVRGVYD